MWETEVSIEVQGSSEAVFDYLADLRRHKEWWVGVAEIEQTTGDSIAVGAEFRAQEVVPVKFTSYSRITRLERPHVIEWRSWDGQAMEVDWSFELHADGPGATTVVQRGRFRTTSLMGRVIVFVLRRKQKVPRENLESLQRLKAAIESAVTAQ
jgi:uncharacterized protein YndB with AHSA1/START domain